MPKRLPALLFPMLTAAALAAAAQHPTEPAPTLKASILLSDAIAIVRQTYGGRVVSAVQGERTVKDARQPGYWVRIDVDGRIKKVFVDLHGRIHEDDESTE